jgi:deoxyribodipyrimidine photo-lyase
MRTVLFWFRRDFRLSDNVGLQRAVDSGARVVPVYVLSDWKGEHGWTGPKRQHFLCGSLESLSRNVEAIGSRLIIRSGKAVPELMKLAAELNAEGVYFNRDPDPFGKSVEVRLVEACAEAGLRCEGSKDAVLHEAGEVLTGSGGPYRVYTPYSKNWLMLEKAKALGPVRSLGPAAEAQVTSLPLPTLAHWGWTLPDGAQLPEPGERAARERMKTFVESPRLGAYNSQRDLPAIHGTSTLSPDLRFGLISIRELYWRVIEAARERDGVADGIWTYVKELAWREFYMALLHYYPKVLDQDFNADYAAVEWPGREGGFERWAAGRTGFPIVDAGMRQLLQTGWMHNRVRMIVAMFLTKDLHFHWKVGEQFFHQHLIDAEIGSNNGGWQWSAGTGADAAPYFRIQNPWSQTKRFDPEGVYIRKWIPELRDVAPKRFLEPPPPGLSLAPGYPAPIVEHSQERDRTMARFAAGRRAA